MRILLVSALIFSVFGGLAVWSQVGSLAAVSFGAGAAMTVINLSILVYAWPRLLAKKLVARSIATIVFKFAILGWILYAIVHAQTLSIGWLAVGLAVVIPSVAATSFFYSPPGSPDEKESAVPQTLKP